MRRRPYTIRLICAEDGCDARGFWEADTRREESQLRQRARNWKCSRHSQPDVVLSEQEPAKTNVLVAHQEDHGTFWRLEGSDRNQSGFAFGPGFKAWAEDFPPGTRLTVTAQVELPD